VTLPGLVQRFFIFNCFDVVAWVTAIRPVPLEQVEEENGELVPPKLVNLVHMENDH